MRKRRSGADERESICSSSKMNMCIRDTAGCHCNSHEFVRPKVSHIAVRATT